jgi:hypothetical protein
VDEKALRRFPVGEPVGDDAAGVDAEAVVQEPLVGGGPAAGVGSPAEFGEHLREPLEHGGHDLLLPVGVHPVVLVLYLHAQNPYSVSDRSIAAAAIGGRAEQGAGERGVTVREPVCQSRSGRALQRQRSSNHTLTARVAYTNHS